MNDSEIDAKEWTHHALREEIRQALYRYRDGYSDSGEPFDVSDEMRDAMLKEFNDLVEFSEQFASPEDDD